MCLRIFGIFFILSVVSINANSIKLSQLEKMVADLKVSHDILSQKISEIQFEKNYFKACIKQLHAENENLKGIIHHLQDENRTQKKINSQLEMSEIKTLFKSSEFEELIRTKSTLLQTNKSKTLAESDGLLPDDYKSVKTIGTNSSKPGIKQRGTASNNSGRISSKRLLLAGNLSFFNVFQFNTYLIDVSFSYQVNRMTTVLNSI